MIENQFGNTKSPALAGLCRSGVNAAIELCTTLPVLSLCLFGRALRAGLLDLRR